jgi:hypothetical protein
MGKGVNLLANLSPAYRQSLVASGLTGINEAGNTGRPASPYLEMIDALQNLKQNDPTLYQRVKQETATCLQVAVRTADAGLDIRQLATRRRGAWLRSIVRRLNLLFPLY